MRFLHTADWHAGKKLGRISRAAELEAVLDELVAIARDEKVDAVLVAGDLWDRPLPPLDSMKLVIDALLRLADAAGHVVAIPGNHDSASLFGVLAQLVEDRGVHLASRICRPGEGALVRVASRDGTQTADVACLPFMHEAVPLRDFFSAAGELPEITPGALLGYEKYQERLAGVAGVLGEALASSEIGILMGHWFVGGAELGGGERKIHLGEQYAAPARAIPPDPQYVALGHIHRPQAVPGAPVPTRYSGSPLQLDFSERSHTKEAVIVDITPGGAAKVTTIPLTAGRRLLRVQGELSDLAERAGGYGDAYLDVRVETGGPVFGLAEQVRKILPHAVMVQAVYERLPGSEDVLAGSAERSLADLYAGFHIYRHGVDAPESLLAAVRTLEEEVGSAAS